MDEKEARRLLFQGETGTNVGAQPPMLTESAGRAQFGVPPPQQTFEQRNYRGLPIDLSEGAGFGTIVGTEWRDKPEQKIKYLEGIYGSGNVRSADDGTLLIKVVGSNNQPKEVPVSPKGLQVADVAAVSAFIPETAGALMAMRGARAIPGLGAAGESAGSGRLAKLLGFGREVAAEAVGQEAGGAVKDIGITALDRQPVDALAIARERAGRVPADIAIGTGLGAAGKVAGKVITPFPAERGALDSDMMAARQYFRDQYGVDFPLTAGEATGSQLLKRTEATMSKLPGSSAEFADIRTEKTDRLRRIMNQIQGLPEDATSATLPSDELVGEQAVAAIRAKVDPTQRALETARSDVGQMANQRILTELEGLSGSADRQLYPEKVGSAIRTKAFALRENFQDASRKLYEDAYSLPGGTDRILEAKSLPGNASKLINELPSQEVTTTVASPIVGPTGQPITHTVTGTKVEKEFVPANVLGKLQSIEQLKGKVSLQDLVRMRSDVANDIAQGEAVPGVQTHYLNKIRDTLTAAIEEATDTLPNGNLKTAWKNANKFYADNVGKFHEGPVARLFKDIESRGFVSDENIIRNIGPTEYATFKKFLGASSPEFTQVKRAIVDELLQSSTLPGEALIDGKLFIKELSSLYKNKRAIADDIIGGTTPGAGALTPAKKLSDLASVLRYASEDSAVDASKFRALLASDRPLATGVQQLVDEQAKLNKAYRSQIVKDISERKLGESFDATEFVNRFYKQASPSEMNSVISQLQDNPVALENLRRKIVEKVLYDAQRSIKDTDPSKLGRGELFRPAGSKDLDKVLGDETNRERLQIALGNRTYEDLNQLGKLLRAGEVTESAFAGAGGLSAGMQVASMLKGGIFSYMEDWAKQKVAAIMLTTPGFRSWIGNTALSRADQVGLTRAFIASAPFIEALDRDFKSEQATAQFVNSLTNSVGLFEKYGGNTGAAETQAQKEKRAKAFLSEPAVKPIP